MTNDKKEKHIKESFIPGGGEVTKEQVGAVNSINDLANGLQLDLGTILKNIKKTDNELGFSARGLESKVQILVSIIDGSVKETNKIADKMDTILKSLTKEASILCLIPEKIEEKIVTIIPNIAGEVNKINQQELEELDKNIQDKLKAFDHERNLRISALKAFQQELSDLKQGYLSKFLLGILIIILVSISAASGATYFMLRKFPTKVEVRGAGDLYIKDSNLDVWGNKNLSIKRDSKNNN